MFSTLRRQGLCTAHRSSDFRKAVASIVVWRGIAMIGLCDVNESAVLYIAIVDVVFARRLAIDVELPLLKFNIVWVSLLGAHPGKGWPRSRHG